MRVILAIAAFVVVLAVGWSGFWYWQAGLRQRAIEDWLAQRRADGWVAEASEIRVAGFPSRVDVLVKGLELADPDAGWSWQAEELQVLSLSYKPHHVIAVLPGEQILATPYETLRLHGDTLRGSVIFRPTPRLELDHMTFELGNLTVAGDSGWSATIDKAILATRQSTRDGAKPFAHDLAFNAEGLALPPEVLAALRVEDVLPARIGTVALDATIGFDRAWDRPALEAGNPTLEDVRIRDLSLTWGKLDLRGRGDLTVDAQGFAEGRIDWRARDWREMIDLAERGGLNSALAGTLRTGLGLLQRFSGSGDALEVPLDFANGRASLGPIPIGAAPRLARR